MILKCQSCNTKFEGRRDAKSCSPACRKRLQRSRSSLASEITRVASEAKAVETAISTGLASAASSVEKHLANVPVVSAPVGEAGEGGFVAVPDSATAVAEPVAIAEPPAVTVTPTPVAQPAPVTPSQPLPAVGSEPQFLDLDSAPSFETAPQPVVAQTQPTREVSQSSEPAFSMPGEPTPAEPVVAEPSVPAESPAEVASAPTEQLSPEPPPVATEPVPAPTAAAPVAAETPYEQTLISEIPTNQTLESSSQVVGEPAASPTPENGLSDLAGSPVQQAAASLEATTSQVPLSSDPIVVQAPDFEAPVLNDAKQPPWQRPSVRSLLGFRQHPLAYGLAALAIVLLGTFGTYSHLANKHGVQVASLPTNDNTLISDAGSKLSFNRDTVIADGHTFTATGTSTFRNTKDSQNAFSVQNAAGNQLLTVNTITGDVHFGDNVVINNTGINIGGKQVCDTNGCVAVSKITVEQLPASVTLQGNSFNGANELVQLTSGGILPALNGSNLTAVDAETLGGHNSIFFTNASNIASGTLDDARLSGNVTLQGNSFNGANELVQLDGSGALPAVDGSALTNVNADTLDGNDSTYFTNASNIISGTLADARLSANVALLNGTGPQSFTGNNQFTGTLLSQNAVNSTGALRVVNAAGSTTVLAVDTTNNRVAVGQGSASYTLDVAGDVNTSTAYRINGVQICTVGGCTAASGSGDYIQNQNSVDQAADFRISGTGQAGFFIGDGSGLTNLDAGNITSGTLDDARLSGNVTLQGNTFNGANQLVQLDNLGRLPVLDAVNLTNIDASNIAIGTLLDARLSANVPLKSDNNIFIGTNTFNVDSASALKVQNAAATSNTLVVDTNNSRVAINQAAASYTLDVAGDVNVTSGHTFRINGNTICDASGCTPASGSNNYVQLQGSSPGSQQTGSFNISGTAIAASFSGSGAALTSLNASNISSGTLSDARLSANVALLDSSQTFTAHPLFKNASNSATAFRIQDSTSGNVLTADTTTDTVTVANLVITGTCTGCGSGSSDLQGAYDASTNPEITVDSTRGALTIQDNPTPLGANLLEVTSNGGGTVYFAVDSSGVQVVGQVVATSFSGNGAALTNLDAGNISSGTLSDTRLSANVALLNGTGPQTFTGNNKFTGTFLSQNASDSANAFRIQDSAGNSYLAADTSGGALSLCNSANCDTINIGTNTDADAINLGDSGDTVTLIGGASSTIQFNGGNISASELNLLDGHDVALVDTNDAVATAIIGTGALNSGSITSGFGAIDTGSDNITTTGTLNGNVIDRSTAGTLSVGTGNATAITLGGASTVTTAAGGLTVTAGKSLTVNGDVFNDLTGNGLTVSSNNLMVQVAASANGLSATTSSGSGLEVLSSGVSLIQGCADGEILKWNETSDAWGCATDSTGAGSVSLQSAYNAGNSITTSDDKDIDLVLDDTAIDSNLDIDLIADNTVSISRNDGSSTEAPSQLLLLENLDTDLTVPAGVLIQSATGGSITIAVDASDGEIGTALAIGDNNITTSGATISAAELNLLDGHDVALVDTNDSVNTAITGTGALDSGSITSGFGSINTGADNITTSGTVGTAAVTTFTGGNATFSGTVNLGTVGSGSAASTVHIADTSDGTGTQTVAIGSSAKAANAVTISGGSSGGVTIINGSTNIGPAELNLLDGHDVALVDTNDAVATAIIGTGALNSGSITSGFGAIDTGADNITTTGTIQGSTAVLTGSLDAVTTGALAIGNTTATSVSICNSAACDTLSLGTNADADAINIGDSLDTVTITGGSASTLVFNGTTIDVNEIALLDGHDAALVDTNDAVTTAIIGTGALNSGSITSGFGAIDTGADNITTTGSVQGNDFDRSSSGTLTFGNTNATTVSVCNSAACDTLNFGTNADADAINIGDSLDTVTLTGGSSSAIVFNGTTISAAELNVLDAGIDLGTETSGDYVADITAGNGLTGDASGEGSTPTLAVGAGNGISVAADSVAVNQDYAFNWTNSQTWTLQGTENLGITSDLAGSVNVVSLVATPSSTSGTTRGYFVQQANSANTNGLDAAIYVDNADADLAIPAAISIQNSGGGGYTTIINNQGTLISGSEINLLDGHDVALVDTNDAVATAIIGTGALDSGSITSNFGSIDTGADSITTTGTVQGNNIDRSSSGTLGIGNTNATTLSVCNSAACDTFNLATNADADAINIGDSLDTLTFTGGSGSTFVLNGTTIDTTEFNLLNGHDVALVDTNDAVSTAIVGTGALDSGSITSGFGSIDTGADNITTTGTLQGNNIDRSSSGALAIGNTNATSVSICNSAACDTLQLGTNADADTIAIGDSLDTVTITGGSSSTFVINGVTVDATEFNFLDGHDAALVDTNDAVATAIIGTGALNSGSITSGFGSIDTGSDNISTTGTVNANDFTRSSAGALTFGNTNATSVSICNSAACDTIQLGTNADADAIQIGDSLDTLTVTGGSGSTFVINGVTVDATEFNRLDGKDAALVDTNDAVSTAIVGTGALDSGSITSGFGSIDTGADNITTTGTVQGNFFDRSTAGALVIGGTNATSTTIGKTSAALTLQGSASTVITATSGGNTTTVSFATPTGNNAIVFPNLSGTVCLTSGNCSGVGGTGDVLQNGNSFGAALTLGTNDNYGFNLEVNGTTVASLSNTGEALFQNSTDSTIGFQIQDSTSNSIFTVDTDNGLTILGDSGALTGSAKFFYNGSAGSTTLTVADPGASDYTITLPAATGEVCLTTGNCSGVGGTIGGSGTAGTIPVFATSSTIGDSQLSQSGSVVTASGTFKAATALQAPEVDRASAGALGIGNTNATSLSLCNSAACDTINVGTNADADAINIGDSLDTLTLTGNSSSTIVLNGTTLSAAELNILDSGIDLGSETNGDYVASFTAGNGLTGNATGEGSTPTIAVGAGTGIIANSDDVAVNQDYSFAWTNAQSWTLQGTENLSLTSDLAGTVNVLSLVATPSASAGTTAGLFLQQANSANSNGLDSAIHIDNADTNLSIPTAIKIQNSGGGGYTTIIDNQGTLISSAELNLLDGHDAALVDTNDAVNTAITGTGALDSGSITGGFGSIDTGADNISTTGTVSGNDFTRSSAGALTFGNTNATSVSICNSAACDTLQLGTNADADAIQIGDSLDTVTITGGSSSTFVINGVTVSASEFNLLDGHDAALVDTNDVFTTAIIGTGALDSGSITSGFGSIDTGSDDITTTGTVSGNNIDRTTAGALGIGNTNATSTSLCNSAACDTINVGTNADADAINIGDSLDTITLTGGGSSTIVFNGTTISAAELNVLDGGIDLGTDTNGDYVANITAGNGLTGSVTGEGSTPTLAVGAGNGITANADDIAVNQDYAFAWTNSQTWTMQGTENLGITSNLAGTVNVVSLVATPSSTSGTTRGYFVQQANSANSNGLDAAIYVDNADADLAIPVALSIQNSGGGGYTTVIDNQGTLISGAELNLLDGHDAALVDTNDAVNTAITGTGALNSGSITSGFGAIDTGADNITTSGTVGTAATTTFTGGNATFSGTVNLGTVGSGTAASTVHIADTSDGTGTQTVTIGSAAKAANATTISGGSSGGVTIINGSTNIGPSELNLLDGHDAALVDTNDAVSTAIVGTGALNSGSITSGFGSIDTGADNISTTGTVQGSTSVTTALLDQVSSGTLTIGSTNATTVTVCATANCDNINIGTGGDADTIAIGDSTDTITITGGSASTIVLNGTTISAAELNLLDGHDVALVDTNDAVNTAITGTGALNSGSITSGFGAIDTGADNITTTGTVQGTTSVKTALLDAVSAGALNIGTNTATSIVLDQNTTISGSKTFGTGTGAVSLNGDTTVAAGKNLNLASGAGTFTQTYTGTGAAHSITANSLTTGSALSVTSSNNTAANTAWSGNLVSATNAQSGTAVTGTKIIAGFDVQFTQGTSVSGNVNDYAANIAVKQNDSSSTDANVAAILNLANNDTSTGNQITADTGILINGSNVTDGIYFSGTFGTNLINSSTGNFRVSQAGYVTTNSSLNAGVALQTQGTTRIDSSGNLSNIGTITSVGTASINATGTAGSTIGNATGTFALLGSSSSSIEFGGTNVSATELNRLDGKDAALVDTNDAVSTAIVGTGALNSGSITSGFGSIDTGADNISTTGTVQGSTSVTTALLDQVSSGTLTIGSTNATTVTVCATANCDNINIGTGGDADTIAIGDSTDTLTLIGGSSSTIQFNGGNISAAELNVLDGGIDLGTDTAGDYVADITAGNGLTGDASGEGSAPTLAVGAGNGISVAADSVAVNQDYAFAFTNSHSYTLQGTENVSLTSDLAGTVNVVSLVATPSSTSGTTRGLFVQQANSANTNGLDAALYIDNADADLAIPAAISIQNSGGGGYTTVIDNAGTLISGAELNRLDGKDAALVDVNDAVTTAIVGTGALDSGSITSGFGSIDTGADNITTTGTVSGNVLDRSSSGTLSVGTANATAITLGGASTVSTAAGGLTVTTGKNFTVNGDAFTDLTGNGLTVSTGSLMIQVAASADALSSTTSSGSGLEVLSSGVALLQGCANAEVLSWNEASDVWQCTTISGSTPTLQDVYNNDANGSDSIIALTTADDGIIFRNPAASGSDSTYILTIDQLATGASGGLSIQSAGTGNLFLVTDTTATARDVLTIADGGATTFRNQTNSTSAFQIQDSAGSSNLFVADTSNTRIGIGKTSPGYTVDVAGDVNITGAYRIGGTSVCSGTTCTPAAGSANYIQNQNSGQQSSSNFWISGTGRADTRLQSPFLDTASAGALGLGDTNATSIDICNSAACDDINIGTNTDADTIDLGDSNDTITLGGNTTQSGSATFSTGTGAVSLNGATTVAANKNLSLASGTGTFTQTYTGTSTSAATITANSLTTGAALNVTSANNSAADSTWSAVALNLTNSQGSTAVSSGQISGLNLQFTQNTSVSGNTEYATNIELKQNDSSSTDATVAGILHLGNDDTSTGNQITATNGLLIDGANVTNGINLSGTFGTSLITSTNFSVSQAGAIVGVGVNSGSGLIQGSGGATITGTTNINATGTAATNVGASGGTLTLVGDSSSTIQLNGGNVSATELNRLDGKDAALVDTNDAVATAITGTGALDSGSITSGFGSIDTGADNITTTGTVQGTTAVKTAAVDAVSAGALAIGSAGTATSVGICNSSACDTIDIGNLATTDADAINIGDALDTVTITGNSSSTLVLNGTTLSAAELNLLDGHDVALVDTNDAVATAIVGTGALNAGSITSGFGAIDTGADAITTSGTIGTAATTTFTGAGATFSGTVNLGTVGSGTAASTIHIADTSDGTGTQTITIGSTAKAADIVTIQGGSSGGVNIINGSTTIGFAELNLLDGHDVALVDTNDAVATAIVGTGALNAGSITSGFGAIDTGADNITTSGTIGTASTTTFTGAGATFSSTVAANAATALTTSQTGTIAVFNTNATGVNAFGAATSINLGAAGATIAGPGSLTLQAATTNTLTLNTGGAGTVNLGTANTTAIGIGSSASTNTILGITNINRTGTAATSIGNTTGIFTLTSGGASGWTNTSGNITISTATSGNVILGGSGASGAVVVKPGTDNSGAFTIQNASGTTILTADTSGSVITQNLTNVIVKGGADASGTTNGGSAAVNNKAVAVAGRYIYTGRSTDNTGACSITAGSANPCEIQVYDAAIPGSPTYMGGADITGTTNGGTAGVAASVTGLAVSGRFLYVTVNTNGDATACASGSGNAIGCELQVYDISKPSAPTYLGGGDSTGGTNTGTGTIAANSIDISGRYAFVAKASSSGTCSATVATGCELSVWDISNPAAPTYIGGGDASGGTNTGSGTTANNFVKVVGRYAYVARGADSTDCNSNSRGCEFQIWDVSTPSAPTFVGGEDATGYNNSQGGGVAVGNVAFNAISISGRYAYVASNGDASSTACSNTAGSAAPCEMEIFDISVPATPVYVAGMDSSGSSTGTNGTTAGFKGITVAGRYAYVSKTGSSTACSNLIGSGNGCELQIYDVSGVTSGTSPTYVSGNDNTGGSGTGTNGSSMTMAVVNGRNLYTASDSSNNTCGAAAASGCELKTFDVGGIEATGIYGSSIEAGTLQVQNNLTVYNAVNVEGSLGIAQAVNIQGDLGVGGTTLFKTQTNSTTAFQVQDSTANNLIAVDTSAGTATIGYATQTGTLTFGNATTASTQTVNIESANGTASTQTINIGGGTSTTSGGKVVNIATGTPGTSTTNTVAIGTGGSTTGTVGVTIGSNAAAAHTTVLQGGTGTGTSSAIRLESSDAGEIRIGTTSHTGTISVGVSTGAETINVGTAGTSAKTIAIGNGAASNTITIGSSSGGTVTVNGGSISLTSNVTVSAGKALILGPVATGSAPSGTDGAMYYDSTLAKFRCYQNGAYTDCIAHGINSVQVKTSGSGATYTPTSGVTSIMVECLGGGGAGGGTPATATRAAPGGGAGSYGRLLIVGMTGTWTYTVGTGGTGVSNNNGNAGNDTTFGNGTTTLTCKGGSGGAVATGNIQAGAAGGVAGSGGDINGVGAAGGAGFGNSLPSGSGGDTFLGSGGAGRATTGDTDATGYGAGGGGAATTSAAAQTGGDGTAGIIIITEYR